MDSFGGHNLRKGIRGSSEKKYTKDVPTTSGQKKSKKRQRLEAEETGTSTSGAPGGAGTGERETKRVKKEETSAGTGEISTEASTSRRLEKSRATGDNGGEDGDDRRPKKRKIDNPAEIDTDTRQQLLETLHKMRDNVKTINRIRRPEDFLNNKVLKSDRREVDSITQEAIKLAERVSKQLVSDDPVILQDEIDRLTNKHSPRIQAWADYLHNRYENGDTDAQRPKSTGAEEWYKVSKGRRPREKEIMRAFAEIQRRAKLDLPITAQDLYKDFGKTPYGDFPPGERDDPTDIKLPNGERVRIIQLNKGNAGVTLLIPKVGEGGDLSQIWKHPYRAGAYVRHGTGYAPSVNTINDLGYTWGPFAFGHSHTVGAMTEGLNQHFQANNDKTTNPRDALRWIMYNGCVTAPTFKNYSEEPSDIIAEDIVKALSKPAPDTPAKNGNHNAGAGDGNESFGFPSGTGLCSFEVPFGGKVYQCAMITHSNFGRLRFANFAGVPIEGAFSADEAENAVYRDGGSINSTFITNLPLTSKQLQKVAKSVGERFSSSNVMIPFSHDVAYAISVADSETLPEDPNYDYSPRALRAILDAGPLQSMEFPDKALPIIEELAVRAVDKTVYTSLLASRDIEGNGYKGTRMPQENVAALHYFLNRYKPGLKPIQRDQIPAGIDPDVAMQEVPEDAYTYYHSETSDDESG